MMHAKPCCRIVQHAGSNKIPRTRKTADVPLLFKKGDATLPGNDLPASRPAVGYNALASMTRNRSPRGGAEGRMRKLAVWFTAEAWHSRRPRARQEDGERSVSKQRWDGVAAAGLDKKAFDRLTPDCLCKALERFSLPSPVVDPIKSILFPHIFRYSGPLWTFHGTAPKCRLRSRVSSFSISFYSSDNCHAA